MLRWLTAGESHGPALVATIDGIPAGVEVCTADVSAALARRRLGYGRGARMKFEQDDVEFLGGLRHGRTLGSPIAIRVGNTAGICTFQSSCRRLQPTIRPKSMISAGTLSSASQVRRIIGGVA